MEPLNGCPHLVQVPNRWTRDKGEDKWSHAASWWAAVATALLSGLVLTGCPPSPGGSNGDDALPPAETSFPPDTARVSAAFTHLNHVMDQFHTGFNVYTNQDAGGNHFAPSGWMPDDHAKLTIDTAWTSDCHRGTSCIQLTFAPGGANWAGIFWQTPEGNWGSVAGAGYDLTGARRLAFWARGATGGEQVEFVAGGLNVSGGHYPDSLPRVTTGSITLADTWQPYEIDLANFDLSHVIGGFGWVTNTTSNPDGATFFLDDIRYEFDEPRTMEPRFLVSYKTEDLGEPDRYLTNAAFVYDNALALLAYLAAGTADGKARAGYIADALVTAQDNDPEYSDGRLRNAYRAGDLTDHISGKVNLPGRWEEETGQEQRDSFQVGSQTGNLAWAILALLEYYDTAGGDQYRDAAIAIGEWIERETRDARGSGGYTGGYEGEAADSTKILWKSTEQNIDVYAAFMRLYKATEKAPEWRERAAHARRFVESMWSATDNHFYTGTTEDGVTANHLTHPVDVQTFAVLALDGYDPEFKNAALNWVEQNAAVTAFREDSSDVEFDGFDFDTDRDGIWLEGTAQMVAAYRHTGHFDAAEKYVEQLRTALDLGDGVAEGARGMFAALKDATTTGFEGWELYKRLHVGATAWYLFAELGYLPLASVPEAALGEHPSARTSETTASFAFGAEAAGVSFQCSLDATPFVGCASPQTYMDLSAGEHRFCVSVASTTKPTPTCYEWTIDMTPPDAFIDTAPQDPSDLSTAEFSFSATEQVRITFQCSLDGEDFRDCSSPLRATELADGSHTFCVSATDEAGNQNATPTCYTWEVHVSLPDNTTPPDFIAGGAVETSGSEVSLALSAVDDVNLTAYFVAENETGIPPADPLPSDDGWQPIAVPDLAVSTEVLYSLKGGYAPGAIVHLYVWFKDAAARVSRVATDTILFSPVTVEVFSDGFEGGWGQWFADNGVWEVGGPPAVGPGKCHDGSGSCAGTVMDGNYPNWTDSRLLSPTLELPTIDAGEEILLRFWHWFSFDRVTTDWGTTKPADAGRVVIVEQVAPGTWGTPVALSSQTASAGPWSSAVVDLSAFAGKTVRIGFMLDNGTGAQSGVSLGWYVDDVSIQVTKTVSLNDGGSYSGGFETGYEGWSADNGVWQTGVPTSGPSEAHDGTSVAATGLGGNYPNWTDSRLVSPTLELPAITAGQEIHLRFWHWFSFDRVTTDWGTTKPADAGRVVIYEMVSPGTWSAPTVLSSYEAFSGAWSYPLVDLSAYAGKEIRIGFMLDNGSGAQSGTAAGWYIDEITISVQ